MRGGWDIGAVLAGAPLGEALSGASSAAELVHRVVHHLARAAGAGGAAFALPTDDGRHLLLTSEGPGGDEGLTTFPLSDPRSIAAPRPRRGSTRTWSSRSTSTRSAGWSSG